MSQIPLALAPLNTSFYNKNGLINSEGEQITSPTREEISTLFVVGFPEDMQEREFQNMFMFSPGFEAATLKVPSAKEGEEEGSTKKQIIGFVKFRTRKEAKKAQDVLNGRKVDLEKGSILKAEMAKKNLHTKKATEPEIEPEVRFHTPYEAFYSVPPSTVPKELLSPTTQIEFPDLFSPPMRSQSVDARSADLFTKRNSRFRLSSSHRFETAQDARIHLIHPSASTPNIYRSLGGMIVGSTNPADQNPPCNTLYVGNLPPNASQEELVTLFSVCVGYRRLSFRNKSNGPMCFVEFDDTMFAAQALQDLHGNMLSNSVKGGIRLSFSKNPLGVRQGNNSLVTSPVE